MSETSDLAKAKELDEKFPDFKHLFAIPTLSSLGIEGQNASKRCYYFCGNSLGLMPVSTEAAVLAEIDAWKQRGVVSHFDHPSAEPWVSIDEPVTPLLAPVIGAKDASEVAIMNTLTGNLHTMLTAFYKPTATRYKILFEQKAFPSDTYAFQGQVQLHGYTTEEGLIPLAPRPGEYTLRTKDILETIEQEGDSIAVVIFSGIQFYTGQLFDIEAITRAGQAKGCVVGWDLAHAAGNVPMNLHDWNVDFAVFCTYKYLNSGPGSIGGMFLHSKYADDTRPRLAGWWGNNPKTRFQMSDTFEPIRGAEGFRMSNPSVLNTVCLGESLKAFKTAGGIEDLRQRSVSMTNFMYDLLTRSKHFVSVGKSASAKTASFTIITPADSKERGAQLSLLFLPIESGVMQKILHFLEHNGVIGDERKPDVIRLAPNHFYNTHEEVLAVVKLIDEAFDAIL